MFKLLKYMKKRERRMVLGCIALIAQDAKKNFAVIKSNFKDF